MTNKNQKNIGDKNYEEEAIYLKTIGQRLKYFRIKAGYTNYEYFA